MRICVTGGAGFIGSHVVDALIKEGQQVVVVDNLSTGKKENIHPKVKFIEMDLQDPRLRDLFMKEPFETVFHIAAQKDVGFSVKDPIADAKINILGSLNLFQACVEGNVQQIIFSSTAGAMFSDERQVPFSEDMHENPISPYGIAKRSIEYYLDFFREVHHLPSTTLRYTNVYGPRQDPYGEAGVIAIFIERLLSGQSASIFGDGSKTRDFIYVNDVVRANILAWRQKTRGVYHIGTGGETSIGRIANAIEKGLNIPEGTIEHREDRPGEVIRSAINPHKAKRELGFEALVTIDKGIPKTIQWFKQAKS